MYGGLVVDVGYGSSIWAQQLVAAGYEVIGVGGETHIVKEIVG